MASSESPDYTSNSPGLLHQRPENLSSESPCEKRKRKQSYSDKESHGERVKPKLRTYSKKA